MLLADACDGNRTAPDELVAAGRVVVRFTVLRCCTCGDRVDGRVIVPADRERVGADRLVPAPEDRCGVLDRAGARRTRPLLDEELGVAGRLGVLEPALRVRPLLFDGLALVRLAELRLAPPADALRVRDFGWPARATGSKASSAISSPASPAVKRRLVRLLWYMARPPSSWTRLLGRWASPPQHVRQRNCFPMLNNTR